MDFEHYIYEQDILITALNRISQILKTYCDENYGHILNEKFTKNDLKELFALIETVQMIAYCLRIQRNESYKETFKKNFENEISFEDIMFKNYL